MKSRFRFVFVIFSLTAILIFTICLRNANNRIFYELCMRIAEQGRLKQELGNKQLRLENLINPASVLNHLDHDSP